MVRRSTLLSRAAAISLAFLGLGATMPNARANVTPLYVFGDSLSDNGNLAEIFNAQGILSGQNFPNPPSYNNSFTNGPVAASILASRLGTSLTPSLWVTNFQDPFQLHGGASFVPGTNYAVAGATSQLQAVGGSPAINLPQQVGAYSFFSGGSADANALYMVMIGGNDVRDAALNGTGAPAIVAAVTTEIAAIATLIGEGARNLLIVNVPNVGAIPEFALNNPALAATATALSQLYDTLLAGGLASLMSPPSTHLVSFDLYGFNTNLLANAASYGLTDVTNPCYTNTPLSAATSAACGANAQNIAHLAFWDEVHPTSTVHALWADAFGQAVGAPVPEPSTWAMMLIGTALLGFFGVGGRFRRASSVQPLSERPA